MRRTSVVLQLCAVVLPLALAGCTSSPTSATTPATPQARTYWVFNSVLEFNETTFGLPHDFFSPDSITVNKGDTVTIHFYNTEVTENHTFTMEAPYALDHVVPPQGETNLTFVASTPGIFAYRCTEHQPTMTGYLIVLG